MKVYVDIEDKDFLDACLSECRVYEYVADELKYSDRLKLVSLAEHDKQIRKEVVQEIKKQSHSCLGEQYIDHAKNNVVFSHHIIIDTTILNQIENGGINEKIDSK